MPAVCGKGFQVEICHADPVPEPPLQRCKSEEEMSTPLRYYALRCSAAKPAKEKQPKPMAKERQARPEADNFEAMLGSFFVKLERKAQPEQAVELWLRSAFALAKETPSREAQEAQEAQRDGSQIRKVQRKVALPSGPTFTIIDSQPASRANADRAFSQNLALWEHLPRGHAEVRGDTGSLLCELAAMRKFGSSEEKFGPLAREAGGARRCALSWLPASVKSLKTEHLSLAMVFTTKAVGPKRRKRRKRRKRPNSPRIMLEGLRIRRHSLGHCLSHTQLSSCFEF